MSKLVEPYINHLIKMKSKLEKLGQLAVMEKADFIIFTLTERQLALGLNSKGSVAGTYADYTALKASDPYNKPRRPKVRGQNWNFDWSGQLFETMQVKAKADSFSIYSSVGKGKFLEKEFGQELMTLTDENNKMINETVILPYLYKYILENMFKF
jgi:hypothetical protein